LNKVIVTNLILHQLLTLIKRFCQVQSPSIYVWVLTTILNKAHHTISIYPRQEVPFFIVFSGILCFSFMTLTVIAYHFPNVMTQYAKAVSIVLMHIFIVLMYPCTGDHHFPVYPGQIAGHSSFTSCRLYTTIM